jgi:hypothetical protein
MSNAIRNNTHHLASGPVTWPITVIPLAVDGEIMVARDDYLLFVVTCIFYD